MTHGSLFSGIGGFDLGAEWVGIPTVWQCELAEFARKILQKNFHAEKIYENIKDISNEKYVDIISFGFPCQDISIANNSHKGIFGKRSSLFFEAIRICGEIRPRFILIENSPLLLVRGFEYVLRSLSEIGYCCEWRCLSNSDFGFPHKREKIYIIAYPLSFRQKLYDDKHGFFTIIHEEIPEAPKLFAFAEGILQAADSINIRTDDGVPLYSHQIGSLGNAVNPIIAAYLFSLIKSAYVLFGR
jgi:DNA (cytosine-5)-methyltransferase 1